MSEIKSKLTFVFSMLIFGTIGIFRRYIPLSSGVIAFSRGIIGAVFLIVVCLLKKEKPFEKLSRKNMILLITSGAVLGLEWVMFLESYQYTTVATATLCYYMAPVIVLLLSPILFKERITPTKLICCLVSVTGMVLVCGNPSYNSGFKGIFLGLGAAVLYSVILILNKYIKDISSFTKTIYQLLIGATVVLPYMLIKETVSIESSLSFILLLFIGIVHTGFAYRLYFKTIELLNAQTVALLSYIDPASAIILSAVILGEKMTVLGFIGALMIIGSAVASEFKTPSKKGAA